MPIVLVTSRSFGTGAQDLRARLDRHGWSVVTGPSTHDLGALAPALSDAEAWIAGTGPVRREHLDAAPALRIIARYGVGVDAVDLSAARDRGILVANTPGANSDAVADHTVGLLLAAVRHTAEGDRRVRRGDWAPVLGREIGGLTVGIVGFGRIGRGVARRLAGFGCRIVAADPFVSDDDIRAGGAEPLALDDLAAACDAVTLHAPGGQSVVDAHWLSICRPGQVLVNTARPDLVDEHAVAAALRDGRLDGYAADLLNGDTAGIPSPLLAPDLAPAVTITPHFGAHTREAVDRMGSMAVDAVLSWQRGERPEHLIDTEGPR